MLFKLLIILGLSAWAVVLVAICIACIRWHRNQSRKCGKDRFHTVPDLSSDFKSVCAWCEPPRVYSGNPAAKKITHGICPECAARHFKAGVPTQDTRPKTQDFATART